MFFRVSNERRMFNLCWNDFIPLGLGNGQRDTVPLQAREDGRRRKKIGTPCWIDITNSAVEILLNHAQDRECSGYFDEIEPNDVCVRVSYISGQRMVHGTVLIVWKIGTNTYLVKTVSGETVRCHGYQLRK